MFKICRKGPEGHARRLHPRQPDELLRRFLEINIGQIEAVSEAAHVTAAGVVCGHIHHAEIREIAGVTYCNDGDWVESCTALVEHADGRLEILHWVEDHAAFLKPAPARPTAEPR